MWEVLGTPGSEPVIRVRQLKENVAALRHLPESQAAAVSEGLEGGLEAIERAPSSAWMSIATDAFMNDVVDSVGGEAAVSHWAREAVLGSLGSPMLREFMRGVLSVFGRRPSRIVKYVPRGMATVYRNAGSWKGEETSDGFVDLHYRDVPTVYAASRNSMVALAAALEAVLAFAKVESTATFEQAGNHTCFHVRWPEVRR